MKTYKLRDLLEIKNGRDHKELKNGIYPVYGSGGVMRYVDTYLYDKPSVLLPRKGTLDNIQYANKPFWTVDTLYYTEVRQDLVNAYYLYNYLKLLDLSNLDSGTGVPSMTFDSYYNLNVNIPSLPTQQKIAAVLSALDDKIALNRRINAKLEAMAKRLYDHWFVQFDFPGDADGKMEYNATLKREIPAGWEVKKLGDFALIKRGTTITEKDTTKGNVKVVAGGLDFSYYHNQSKRKANCITVSGSGENAGFVNFWRKPIFASDCSTVQCENDTDTILCYFALKMQEKRFYRISHKSAQPHIYPKDVAEIPVVIPNEVIKNKISDFFIKANNEIAVIETEIQKLTTLRDRLLPLLMNGQVIIE